MASSLRGLFLGLGALSVTVAACGGDDTVFVTNGANDLRKACDIRTSWTNTKSVPCLECLTSAPLATCNCLVKTPFVGKCAQQLALKKAAPDCDDALERCTNACGPNACGCLDNCYSSRAGCKVRAAALDGCVADVCAEVCR